MNLKTVLRISRNAGLCAAVALFACDSGAKAEEPKKVEAKADDAKAAEDKAVAEKAAADAKAAEEKAAADAKAAEDKAAEDAKAPEGEDEAAEEKAAEADDKAPVAAVKELKKPEAKKAEAKKVEDASAKIDAKALYLAKCKACHGVDGKGVEAQKKNNIPDMTTKEWQGKNSKAAVVKAIADGVDGTKMKAFKEKMTKEEIDAVAAYVKKM